MVSQMQRVAAVAIWRCALVVLVLSVVTHHARAAIVGNADADIHIGALVPGSEFPCHESMLAELVLRANARDGAPVQYSLDVVDYGDAAHAAMFHAMELQCALAANDTCAGTCRPVDVIFGPYDSEPCTAVAYGARRTDTPQLSPLASASQLDDRSSTTGFPAFSRTIASTSYDGDVVASLVAQLAWDHVSMVVQENGPMQDAANALHEGLHQRGVEVDSSQVVDDDAGSLHAKEGDIKDHVESLRKEGTYVIVVFVDDEDLLEAVVNEMFAQGMLDPPWVLVLWTSVFFDGADMKDLARKLDGHVVVYLSGLDTSDDEYDDLIDVWRTFPRSSDCTASEARDGVNAATSIPGFFDGMVYDGFQFLLGALDAEVSAAGAGEALASDSVVSRSDVLRAIRTHVSTGVSGFIRLDEAGNRVESYTLGNFVNGEVKPVGTFATFSAVSDGPDGEAVPPAMRSGRWNISPVTWPGGVTVTPRATGQQWTMSGSMTALLVSLTGLVGLMWILSVVFTIKLRRDPVLLWSNPTANACTLVGVLVTLLHVSHDLDISSLAVESSQCILFETLSIIGWTFLVGSIVARLYRFDWAMKHHTMAAIPNKPTNFSRVFGALLVLSVCWMLILQSFSPPVPRPVATIDRDHQLVLYTTCQFAGQDGEVSPLAVAFGAYLVVVLMWGTVMGIKTRRIPAGYHESRYLGFAIYSATIVALFALIEFSVTSGSPAAALILRTLRNLIPCIVTLAGLFGTKAWALYQRRTHVTRTRRGASTVNPLVELEISIDESSRPPEEWGEQRDNFVAVSIEEGSAEWRDVVSRAEESMPGISVVEIKRLQNIYLWVKYADERSRMLKRNGDAGVNEQLLWHGTGAVDPSAVYAGLEGAGFDVRMTREGNYYGRGAYFSERLAYSDNRYTTNDHETGARRVLLARVLCGIAKDYGRSKQRSLVRPPQRRGVSDLYDSVMGGPHGGGLRDTTQASIIHVVYNTSQAYPAYEVTYKPAAFRRFSALKQRATPSLSVSLGAAESKDLGSNGQHPKDAPPRSTEETPDRSGGSPRE